jgi:hypothetical protein
VAICFKGTYFSGISLLPTSPLLHYIIDTMPWSDLPGDKNLGSSQEPSMFFIMTSSASCGMIREARP